MNMDPAVLWLSHVWSRGIALFDEWMNSNQVLVTREQKFPVKSFHGDVVLICSFLSRGECFLVSENIIFSQEASAPNLLIFWYFALISTSNAGTDRNLWVMGNFRKNIGWIGCGID